MRKCHDLKTIEKQIFNELKDSIINYNYLVGKYQGLDIDYSKLYNRIIKYQFKQYGIPVKELREEEKKNKRVSVKNISASVAEERNDIYGRSRSFNQQF